MTCTQRIEFGGPENILFGTWTSPWYRTGSRKVAIYLLCGEPIRAFLDLVAIGVMGFVVGRGIRMIIDWGGEQKCE